MPDDTLSCKPNHWSNLPKKPEGRLSEAAMSKSTLIGKTSDELRAFLWAQVQKEIVLYLDEHPYGIKGIDNYGFVFGNPFSDTAFMLTPLASAAGMLTYTFNSDMAGEGSRKFAIDFYQRM